MRNKPQLVLLLLSVFLIVSCNHKKTEDASVVVSTDLKNIISSDTLRVATMYGATSYFLFRDEFMGFDYEMAENLASRLNVNLKISIAQNQSEMEQLLLDRKVDIICYNTIETKNLKKDFHFVFPQPESYQVLVQNMGVNALSDVTQLAGKSVYVKANSIFHQRLKALNEEIGGKINIVLAADSLSNEDLIDLVAENKIEYTLAYHNLAMLHKSYYNRLNCRLPVGFNQPNGWMIRAGSKELQDTIEKWEKLPTTVELQSNLYHKYWEKSPYFAQLKVKIPRGAISPYDKLFKKYAALINWDWRLLAALVYHESRFDSSQISWVGAAGLMQLMPRTAANFGLDKQTVFNPEMNIEAGVQYIKSLNLTFRKVENKDERVKFILAGYNSGPAHILDAMALAQKYGKNPQVWFGNVEFFLLKKSEPEFYNDKVVKYGYFRGKQTVSYVHNTLKTFEKYLRKK
ncbi:MAG: transglycosylase SLT domain-containing protein [Paludibacter sp.]|nr:transglycosylase SLT domain-containing protein [Paludibacter sp.]